MNKLIVRISEGLGNQLFMYANAYSLSKKINYNLFIDNISAYKKIKITHFLLDKFNIKLNYAAKNDIQDNFLKYIKHKIQKKTDFFRKKRKFIIEKKYLHKNTKFNNLLTHDLSNKVFLEGHFESEKYFYEYKKNLKNIFKVKESLINNKSKYIDDLTQNNSVSICIRQNRYSEGKLKNDYKSSKFTKDTIEYVDRAVKYVKQKVNNPKFFVWSNDFNNLNEYFNKNEFTFIENQENKALNDFHLFSYSKHFIVGPTSFHWWGAWLNDNPDKLCIRPSNINPSNNKDFWPNSWVNI